MTTYILESNLTAWAIEAPDALTAACAWVRNGVRDEDEGHVDLVRVKGVADKVATYPLRTDGEALTRHLGSHRDEIEAAAKTVRRVDYAERQALRADARVARLAYQLGHLEGLCTSLLEDLAGHVTPDTVAQLRRRIEMTLAEVSA